MIDLLISLSGALVIGCAAVAVMTGHQASVYNYCDDKRAKKYYIISYSCIAYIALWLIGAVLIYRIPLFEG